MDVIWQTKFGRFTEFELQSISEVTLKDCECAHYFDENRYQKTADNPLIVFSTDIHHHAPQELLSYLEKFDVFKLFHIECERLDHDASYYKRASVVLRSYYDPRLPTDNTYFLPLGFQSGFLNPAPGSLSARRDFVWCFAGQVKSHRARMLAAFRGLGPHFVHITKTWADPNGLNVDQMKQIYSSSMFALCPFGNRNPDSYRLMEALEWGCIPVTLTFLGGEDYFRYIYGDHPFIVAQSWQDACEQVKELLQNPDELLRRQHAAMQWYQTFKADLAEDVSQILSQPKHSRTLKSRQFSYQAQGQSRFIRTLYDLYYGRGALRRLYRWFVSL